MRERTHLKPALEASKPSFERENGVNGVRSDVSPKPKNPSRPARRWRTVWALDCGPDGEESRRLCDGFRRLLDGCRRLAAFFGGGARLLGAEGGTGAAAAGGLRG